jgi:viroplasmin and RNaseH domain-containing protein
MSRNGKIARLPAPLREQINLRLQNGEKGRDIIAWLNSNNEVKALLASEFGGHEISDDNLSQWKHGGYHDWEMLQATLAETQRIVSEGAELDKVGEKALGDKLAAWMLGRYAVATRKLIEHEDDQAAWKLLREVCHDLVALRRGDHFAEWLRIDREKLALHLRREEREQKAAQSEAEAKSAAPVLTDEEKERKWRQIFGMQPL